MTRQELAQIHARFFRPDKSPHTQWIMDDNKRWVIDYYLKNPKRMGIIVWNKGTYIRSKHGEL